MAQATVRIGNYTVTVYAYTEWKDEGIGWNEAWGSWDYNEEWRLRMEDFEIEEVLDPEGEEIPITECEFDLHRLRELIWEKSDEIEDQHYAD